MVDSAGGDRLAKAVLDFGFEAGNRLLVAASGGADSTALLLTLAGLAPDPAHRWHLLVCHVHHGLRGAEADADREFVAGLASELGLPCDIRQVDTRAYARQHRLSVEAAARTLRYGALRDALHEWNGDLIVTGHTLDDQAETVFLRLLRGSGLLGLSGMRPRRGDLVRPLLTVRRNDVAGALAGAGIRAREDSSNQDPAFERNRVRRELLSLIESIRSGSTAAVARSAAALAHDADLVSAISGEAAATVLETRDDSSLSASLPVWRALHPALRLHVLRLLSGHLLPPEQPLDYAALQLMAHSLERGAQLHGRLPAQLSLELDGHSFILRRGRRPDPPAPAGAIWGVPGSVKGPWGELRAEVLPRVSPEELGRLLAVCGTAHALCDASALAPELQVRSWRPGDRLQPLGLQGSKKLQDLFVDAKVPRRRRGQIPIVESGGAVVWVPGLALLSNVAATAQSGRIMHLWWRPQP